MKEDAMALRTLAPYGLCDRGVRILRYKLSLLDQTPDPTNPFMPIKDLDTEARAVYSNPSMVV